MQRPTKRCGLGLGRKFDGGPAGPFAQRVDGSQHQRSSDEIELRSSLARELEENEGDEQSQDALAWKH